MTLVNDPTATVGSPGGSGASGVPAATGASAGGAPGIVFVGFLVAGVLAIVAADYAPHLVNGLLALILAGLVLQTANVWSGQINAFAAALNTSN